MFAPLLSALVLAAAPVLTPEVSFGTSQSGTAADDQENPRAASSPTSTLVVWTESRGGDDYGEIWGTLLTGATGAMQSTALRIAVAGDVERYPGVAFGGGKFLVAWNNLSAGLVLGRFYRVDGQPEGDPFVISFRSGDSMDVTFDGTAFIAVWHDYRGGTGADIQLAEVTVAGAVTLRTASQALGDQHAPVVGCDGARRCLVVWEDSRNAATSQRDLWGTRVDFGQVLDPNGFEVMNAVGNQSQPSVAWAPSNWLVTLFEETLDEVQGVRLDPNAVRIGSAFAVFTGNGPQSQGRVVPFQNGYLAVTVDDGAMKARRFDASGAAIDPAPVRICPVAWWYTAQPVVATPAPNTEPLVVWHDKRFEEKDIFGAHLGPALGPIEDGGFAVSLGGSAQRRPKLATNGTGYLAVWVEDGPGRENRVVGSELDASGTPVGGVIPFSAPAADSDFPWGGADVAWANGRYLVVWDGLASTGRTTIYGRSYLPGAGQAEGSQFHLADAGSPDEQWPSIGGGPQQFLVAWNQGGEVYARRVTAVGAPLDPNPILVAGSTFQDDAYGVRANGDDFVVLWEREDPADWTPHLGRVSGAGVALDGPLGVTPTGPGFSSGNTPAFDCSGRGCLIAWDTGGDIYGQLYDAQLVAQRPAPFVLSRAGNNQRNPVVAWQQGQYLVAWEDGRSAVTTELFANWFDPAAGLTEPGGVRLVTGPYAVREAALATVSPSKALLAYTRLDDAPGVNAPRVKVRAMVAATDGTLCAFSPDGTACNSTGSCASGLCVGGTSTQPGFTSTPGVFLICSQTFRYNADNRPLVVGPGTPTFSLAPLPGEALPEGLTVNPATGELTWTATREQRGQHHAVLIARGDGWAAAQTLEFNVQCEEKKLAVGCGSCSAAPGATALLWLIAALALRRRAR